MSQKHDFIALLHSAIDKDLVGAEHVFARADLERLCLDLSSALAFLMSQVIGDKAHGVLQAAALGRPEEPMAFVGVRAR